MVVASGTKGCCVKIGDFVAGSLVVVSALSC